MNLLFRPIVEERVLCGRPMGRVCLSVCLFCIGYEKAEKPVIIFTSLFSSNDQGQRRIAM